MENSQERKLVTISVPCYNEVENVEGMAVALSEQMEKFPQYNYEIVFIDNCSTDGTRDKLRAMATGSEHVRAILNSKNFGQFNSPYYGITQARGDCCICIASDFQEPVELIPAMVEAWSEGYKLVCPVKTSSKESKILYTLRSWYYRLIRKMSSVEQIDHFTGFGLYDKSFIKVLRELDDPTPFIRGIVAELGPAKRKIIPYEQQQRQAGETHNGFWSLYDAAMLSFTSYTKAPLRMCTVIGFTTSLISLLLAVAFLVFKLLNWSAYPAGSIPILLVVLFIGSLQLFFIGILGEYVLSINARSMRRPLVIEEERINF